MSADHDDLDALFAEAFALLDGAASSPSSRSSSSAKRSKEGSTVRRKRLLDLLRAEETALSLRLRRLRGPPVLDAARDIAIAERSKRQRAERERQALRDAVYQHTQFLRGFQGFFSINTRRSLSLSLYHHLHDFTRLPRDAAVREHEYAVVRRDQRFHAAIDLLCRETDRVVPTVASHIETAFDHEPCATTTTSVYALDDADVPTVLRAACVAIRDIIVRCRAYDWVGTAGAIVDAATLSQSNLQYRLTNIRRKSALDTDDFSIEARTLLMYKMLGDAAVVVWDFVDQDDLHALDQPPDIARQGVGACLIRREICPDGIERTVYRELSTRRYLYQGSTSPSPSVARYLSSRQNAMRDHERHFRDLILEQIANEKAATERFAQGVSV